MQTTPSAEIGANIRAEMARRGVSQTAMASQMGIGQSALSKRLAGTVPLDVNELAAVARFLNVDLSVLIVGAALPEPVAS